MSQKLSLHKSIVPFTHLRVAFHSAALPVEAVLSFAEIACVRWMRLLRTAACGGEEPFFYKDGTKGACTVDGLTDLELEVGTALSLAWATMSSALMANSWKASS